MSSNFFPIKDNDSHPIKVIKNTLQGSPIVNMDEIELESAVDYGGIAVLKELWEELNLSKVLYQCGDIAMIKAMIFSRILFPGSKLMLEMLSEGTALAPSIGLKNKELSSDAQYEAMDKLTGNWAHIEKKLYQDRHNQGLETAQIVLYDITSIYFEGHGPDHIAKHGHSRDHRSDRRQVVVALATDLDGIPIHIEVLKGNRNDQATVTGLLQTMKRRFGIKKAIFVL